MKVGERKAKVAIEMEKVTTKHNQMKQRILLLASMFWFAEWMKFFVGTKHSIEMISANIKYVWAKNNGGAFKYEKFEENCLWDSSNYSKKRHQLSIYFFFEFWLLEKMNVRKKWTIWPQFVQKKWINYSTFACSASLFQIRGK